MRGQVVTTLYGHRSHQFANQAVLIFKVCWVLCTCYCAIYCLLMIERDYFIWNKADQIRQFLWPVTILNLIHWLKTQGLTIPPTLVAGCRPIFGALLWENQVMKVTIFFHKIVSYILKFISWRYNKNLYINFFTIADFLKKIYIFIISKCKLSLNTCLTLHDYGAMVSLRLAVS